MFGATLVDATDGLLARRRQVEQRLPAVDGARLDDIVDYLTFVFLPVRFLYHSGALPAGWASVRRVSGPLEQCARVCGAGCENR